MAGGFIADPRGDFHLEIAVTGEEFAQGLVAVMGTLGVAARLNRRRGAFAIYVQSFEDIVTLLVAMGAGRMARVVEVAQREVREERRQPPRQRRDGQPGALHRRCRGPARARQAAPKAIGLASLPPALRAFCEVRREGPT